MKRSASVPSALKRHGVAHVGLKTSDLRRSTRFFQEILGLPASPREAGIAHIEAGPDRLVLYEEDRGETDIHFGFRVDSPSLVDRWKGWLRGRGVGIHEDVTEEGYRSIKFQDPDGHWIEISDERP